MKNAENYIAIDIGGTYARIASFSSFDNPNFENIKVFKLSHIFENDFKEIIETIKNISNQNITAISIGLPGVLNEQKNGLIFATNIPEWTNINLKNKLLENFNSEIYMENDAVTSALGEALYGGNQKENFIYIIWGTGVGGAIVEMQPKLKARKILREEYIQDVRQKCYGKSLLEKYSKLLSELEEKDWNEIISDFEKLIIGVSEKFQIKNIVVGGGIALKQSKRLLQLTRKLKEYNSINFTITALGDNHIIGLYGASALIKCKSN